MRDYRDLVLTIRDNLATGNLQKVQELLEESDDDVLRALLEISMDENFVPYFFLTGYVDGRKNPKTLGYIVAILEVAFPHLEGSYFAMLSYLRMAIEMDQSDFSIREKFLSILNAPDSDYSWFPISFILDVANSVSDTDVGIQALKRLNERENGS
jgi:hypothetical protein